MCLNLKDLLRKTMYRDFMMTHTIVADGVTGLL